MLKVVFTLLLIIPERYQTTHAISKLHSEHPKIIESTLELRSWIYLVIKELWDGNGKEMHEGLGQSCGNKKGTVNLPADFLENR